MESIDQLLINIMNTAPRQLPPIVHDAGCYTLDVKYLGQSYHKVGTSLMEVMSGYLEFVKWANRSLTRSSDVLRDLPIKAGQAIYRNEG